MNDKVKPQGQGMAIASLILSIIGIVTICVGVGGAACLVALILGLVVLIKRKPGKGMAIAGIIVSAIGLIIFFAIAGLLSYNSKRSVKIESTVVKETELASKPTETIVKTETEQENVEEHSNLHVGDILETKNEKLKYLSCDTDFQPSNQYFEAKDGNKIIRLEFEYENVGKTDQSISFYSFTGYADGYKADAWYYEDDNISGTISAGKKVKGSVYFEVPDDAQNITVEYDVNVWTSEKAVFIVE
ncbi:DUF4190 domain-containing protein [Enterocloster citroniae]|uniref:DUF4190 domain-containing protein n=1 Tax=Enterocloster citroniae TaxID=358743 RepID=UPI0022E4A6CA|nr:DUF4190 domain-containing protein [Enterocloster citroniae]